MGRARSTVVSTTFRTENGDGGKIFVQWRVGKLDVFASSPGSQAREILGAYARKENNSHFGQLSIFLYSLPEVLLQFRDLLIVVAVNRFIELFVTLLSFFSEPFFFPVPRQFCCLELLRLLLEGCLCCGGFLPSLVALLRQLLEGRSVAFFGRLNGLIHFCSVVFIHFLRYLRLLLLENVLVVGTVSAQPRVGGARRRNLCGEKLLIVGGGRGSSLPHSTLARRHFLDTSLQLVRARALLARGPRDRTLAWPGALLAVCLAREHLGGGQRSGERETQLR